MDKSNIELVMASVSWRTEGLNTVLNAAREQGIKHVALVLDRYTKESEARVDFSGFDSLRIKRLSPHNVYVGSGYRYFLACTSSFPVVEIVDDDLNPGEDYFDQNLEALLVERADCVAWAGCKEDGSWIPAWQTLEESTRLFSIEAGNCIFRTESIRSFLYDKRFRARWCKHYYKESSYDEVLISCWLYKNNKKMIRPPAALHVSHIEHLRKDERSLQKRVGPVRRKLIRNALAAEMDWHTQRKRSWFESRNDWWSQGRW